MSKQAGTDTSETPATSALAGAIARFAQTDGDHTTAIPALTLHRRKAPTEPLHCIYNLGLGVVAQGDCSSCPDELVRFLAVQERIEGH